MTEPLVSVKMITYNHAPYIAQAIEGVLQQKTNFPFELVIGEDCSTDGTREIVFEYAKKYPDIIRVVTSDQNVGMKKNGLRTLQACRGKYVAFCEGDDYWQRQDKLQKQADYLEGHLECGLVYASYDVYHVASKQLIRDFVRYKKWKMPETMTVADLVESKGGRSRAITTCAVMLRRNMYEKIIEADPYLYQSEHFLMGDTQLWAEIAAQARLHFISESLATHTIVLGSATRSKDVAKALRFSLSGAKLQLYLCGKYDLPQHVRTKYQNYMDDCKLRFALHTGDKKLAGEIRKKKKRLTVTEWIRYCGAGNPVVRRLYQASASVRNMLRRKDSQWR